MRDLTCIELVSDQIHASSGCCAKILDLLPSQSYYFTMRGVSYAGKGEFSEIVGPFTLKQKQPEQIEPLEMYKAGQKECKLLLKLPYNMGNPINKATVIL